MVTKNGYKDDKHDDKNVDIVMTFGQCVKRHYMYLLCQSALTSVYIFMFAIFVTIPDEVMQFAHERTQKP